MIHLRVSSLPKLILLVVGMLLVADWMKEEGTKTRADNDKPKSKKKGKGKKKQRKAEEIDTDDEKDVEGDAVDDE